MNDLIQLVSQKAGINPEQAKGAVDTVLGFLKDRLPAPVAGQLDQVLGGEGGGPTLGDAIKHLRGAMGS